MRAEFILNSCFRSGVRKGDIEIFRAEDTKFHLRLKPDTKPKQNGAERFQSASSSNDGEELFFG
jgi:hypothetical protein